jgi:hypothetical protein
MANEKCFTCNETATLYCDGIHLCDKCAKFLKTHIVLDCKGCGSFTFAPKNEESMEKISKRFNNPEDFKTKVKVYDVVIVEFTNCFKCCGGHSCN